MIKEERLNLSSSLVCTQVLGYQSACLPAWLPQPWKLSSTCSFQSGGKPFKSILSFFFVPTQKAFPFPLSLASHPILHSLTHSLQACLCVSLSIMDQAPSSEVEELEANYRLLDEKRCRLEAQKEQSLQQAIDAYESGQTTDQEEINRTELELNEFKAELRNKEEAVRAAYQRKATRKRKHEVEFQQLKQELSTIKRLNQSNTEFQVILKLYLTTQSFTIATNNPLRDRSATKFTPITSRLPRVSHHCCSLSLSIGLHFSWWIFTKESQG